MGTLLVKNIGILQTPTGSCSHRGSQQGENLKLHNAAIFVEDGVVASVCFSMVQKEQTKLLNLLLCGM